MDSDLRLQIKLGPVLSSDAVWKDQKFPPVEVSLIFRQGNEKQWDFDYQLLFCCIVIDINLN